MAGGIAVLPLHTYWDSIICCYIVIHLNVPCVIVMRWQRFISLDCGGDGDFTDDIGIQWTSDDKFVYGGKTANLSVQNDLPKQLKTVRYFPVDDRKYCYTMNVSERTRYLVRATFLYGNFENSNIFPKFDLSLGATPWTTVVVYDDTTPKVVEAIILASAPTLSVCLSNASTGQAPFISTLELRQLNGSLYETDYENQFFLKLSARINFGAESNASVRYPDDPFDRIWRSDLVRRANYLVDVAPGTERISTKRHISIRTDGEEPPEEVMRTAVVGQNGSLTYRLNLDETPGNSWAYAYFAEIEDLAPNETRKFKLAIPEMPEYSTPTVNVEENAPGKYRAYEAGYMNMSLPFVFKPVFQKTDDSSKGPILNARTIWLSWYHGILRKVGRKRVVTHAYQHHGPGYNAVQKKRPGTLSGKNITGSIPVELTKLPGLVEFHLEDNQLTGALPSSLGDLPNLKQFFSGNSNLHVAHNTITHPVIIIVCVVIGAFVLLVAAVGCYLFAYNRKKKPSDAPAKQLSSPLSEVTTESVHRFALSEIEDATDKFDRRIGSGGFGIVYYGKLADGREIAVKLLINDSYQGTREFLNEVTLLSKIHHRNLVSFLGYSQQDGKNILVYEFMHEGTLKEHIRGGPAYVKVTSWVKRLEIAEDAAKGCSPTIIHRDLKSSNILLDKNMRAKVADFGISKPVVSGSHVSTMVRGTFGYLDPEYYGSQQLTEKSDMYSFGVILLELISGQEPISDDHFGPHCRSIVAWATSHIESGNIHAIIDQSLDTGYDLQSVWKIAEVATMCVKPKGVLRPSISEVLKEIQDAIALERGGRELVPSIQHPVSKCSPSVNMDSVVLEQNSRFDELLELPGLR
uniref:Protein kinase domain-containing protein n=1 Tax=Oryza glumipatula TaxID=40148 RepID=A0A0E0BR96_9ORYZ